jgi:hypothetical protein
MINSPENSRVKTLAAASCTAGSLVLSAQPAAAWCSYYGCGYDDYDNSGAAIGGAMLRMMRVRRAKQGRLRQSILCARMAGKMEVLGSLAGHSTVPFFSIACGGVANFERIGSPPGVR